MSISEQEFKRRALFYMDVYQGMVERNDEQRDQIIKEWQSKIGTPEFADYPEKLRENISEIRLEQIALAEKLTDLAEQSRNLVCIAWAKSTIEKMNEVERRFDATMLVLVESIKRMSQDGA